MASAVFHDMLEMSNPSMTDTSTSESISVPAKPRHPSEPIDIPFPIRAGTIFLPNVSIYPLHSPDGSSELQAKVQGVLCESYMENAAQTVKVLPAKKEVTVLVPAPLPEGVPIGERWEGVRA